MPLLQAFATGTAAAVRWLRQDGWRPVLLGLAALLSVLVVRSCVSDRVDGALAQQAAADAQGENVVLRQDRIAADRAVTSVDTAKAEIQTHEDAGLARTRASLEDNADWANQPVPPAVLDSLRD